MIEAFDEKIWWNLNLTPLCKDANKKTIRYNKGSLIFLKTSEFNIQIRNKV